MIRSTSDRFLVDTGSYYEVEGDVYYSCKTCYYELFPEGYEVPVLIFNIVITLILMIVCFKVLGKRKSSQTVFSGVNPYE